MLYFCRYLLANAVAFTRVDDRGHAIQRMQNMDKTFGDGKMWHRALVLHNYATKIEACNSYVNEPQRFVVYILTVRVVSRRAQLL